MHSHYMLFQSQKRPLVRRNSRSLFLHPQYFQRNYKICYHCVSIRSKIRYQQIFKKRRVYTTPIKLKKGKLKELENMPNIRRHLKFVLEKTLRIRIICTFKKFTFLFPRITWYKYIFIRDGNDY